MQKPITIRGVLRNSTLCYNLSGKDLWGWEIITNSLQDSMVLLKSCREWDQWWTSSNYHPPCISIQSSMCPCWKSTLLAAKLGWTSYQQAAGMPYSVSNPRVFCNIGPFFVIVKKWNRSLFSRLGLYGTITLGKTMSISVSNFQLTTLRTRFPFKERVF